MTAFRLIHRVPPHVHEDGIGFLMRVAARNHLKGATELLSRIKGNTRLRLEARDIELIADYCRSTIPEIAQLSGIESRGLGGEQEWQVAGEQITKSAFVSLRRAKICPVCLEESPFVRGYWCLSFYDACAIHGVQMIDRCPGCARRLKWDRRHVEKCSCGFDLRQAPTTPASPTLILLSRLIAHRAADNVPLAPAIIPIRELERLASLSLDGLCKTVWFLGHCLRDLGRYGSGHGRLQPTCDEAAVIADQAFDVLRTWPTSLGEHLLTLACRPPSRSSASLLDRLFGPLQHYLYEEMTGPEHVFIRTAYEYHLRLIWRDLGRRHQSFGDSRQLELEL